MSECKRETSKMRQPWHTHGCCAGVCVCVCVVVFVVVVVVVDVYNVSKT